MKRELGGTEPPTDELLGLAERVQSGDDRALGPLLAALLPPLIRAVRRVLGPGHPYVEDVAHDAAYTVLQQLPQFRGEGTLLGFARRVAVLSAMNARRKDLTRKRARVREAIEPDTLAQDSSDPEARATTEAFLPAVRELLDSLPEEQAEAFALQVILGYSLEEIAQLAGVPLETARSRLRLAKHALKARALAHPVLSQAAEAADEK